MTHSLNLNDYVELLIVMLVNYFLAMNKNFNCRRMAVINLHLLFDGRQ
jgi:hypothetical protein